MDAPKKVRIVPDKSFIDMNKRARYTDPKFKQGLQSFLDFAEQNPRRSDPSRMLCPCNKCSNRYLFSRGVIEEHVTVHGFIQQYRSWVFHGEGVIDETESTVRENINVQVDIPPPERVDETHEMLEDILAAEGIELEDPIAEIGDVDELKRLMEEDEMDLYSGCTEFTKLSFLIRLFHIKTISGLGNKYFDMLLDLLRRVIPEGMENIPKNHYEAKKKIKKLGFSYEKIDACPNDCILYRKEYKMLNECPRCGVSRWTKTKRTSVAEHPQVSSKRKKIPAKVLRYFPLTRRLQQLFITKDMARNMRWHSDCRIKDGKLRHPADTDAWKQLDSIEYFGEEARNVRLGLATDGFNPYGTMSSTWSTWPVLVMPYNIPPWMCMKQTNIILTLLIPGRFSPSQNVDVYLEPLIEELENLWKNGVDTYDAYEERKFRMRTAILWTINDFPAYGMLSGWSVYAECACPLCGFDYSGLKLNTKGKYCYWFHRRWLPLKHTFRKQADKFDGTHERRLPPKHLSGEEIFDQVSTIEIQYGCNRFQIDGSLNKPSKRKRSGDNQESKGWKKRSIFFRLPYWKHLLIRHNIDVMHVEKNVCDNLLSTLLQDQSKSKDNLNARNDLRELGIRPELHPVSLDNNIYELPASSHTMTKDAMKIFCEVLKNLKTPDGFCSNISNNVHVDERKIINLKTHDYHVLLHQLIPVALRHNLPSTITKPLMEFCGFFNKLCSKIIDVSEFEHLETSIVETLCKLEMIFPPYFFTIMVHLTIHLATEARIAGPVTYRWMYPIERYLGFLKRQLRNRSRPEGSIAENYVANECLNFISRYLRGVETRFNRPPRVIEGQLSCPKGEDRAYRREWLDQAHAYILNNLEIVDEYRRLHIEELKKQIRSRDAAWKIDQQHKKHFPLWFRSHIESGILRGLEYDAFILRISKGPHPRVTRYGSYCINNIKFHTSELEAKRATQNNGVCCPFEQNFYSSARDQNPIGGQKAFFGQLEDIIEICYGFNETDRFVMFKVRWCACPAKDEFGFQLVNLKKEIYKDDKFMLASQAEQCFYVKVTGREDTWIALKKPPRSLFDSPGEETNEDDEEECEASTINEFEPNFYYTHPFESNESNESLSTTTKGKEIATG